MRDMTSHWHKNIFVWLSNYNIQKSVGIIVLLLVLLTFTMYEILFVNIFFTDTINLSKFMNFASMMQDIAQNRIEMDELFWG